MNTISNKESSVTITFPSNQTASVFAEGWYKATLMQCEASKNKVKFNNVNKLNKELLERAVWLMNNKKINNYIIV